VQEEREAAHDDETKARSANSLIKSVGMAYWRDGDSVATAIPQLCLEMIAAPINGAYLGLLAANAAPCSYG